MKTVYKFLLNAAILLIFFNSVVVLLYSCSFSARLSGIVTFNTKELETRSFI